MKNSKQAFVRSVIALLLCVSMFVGTTFAWFTDSVTSVNNIIQTGILDVELDWFDESAGAWKPVDQSTNVFAEDSLWEPGYTEVVYLRVRNAGNLALKYQLGVRVAEQTQGININDEPFLLSDYIYMGVATENVGENSFYATREAARAAITSSNSLTSGKTVSGEMLKDEADEYFALVVYMPESVGNEANYKVGTTQPTINLGITLLATQMTAENDAFGPDYDTNATFPVLKPGSVTVPVTPGADNRLTADVPMTNKEGTISAIIPAGTLLNPGTTQLTLSVSELSATQSNVVLKENEILRPMDVHVEGISAQNTTPAQVTVKEAMMPGLNVGNYNLYHVEDGATNEMTAGALNAHNGFAYDPATGDVTLSMATYSEFTLVADTEKKWEGNFDYSWYDASKTELTIANADQLAAFGAIVGGMDGQKQDSFSGKTVKLIADINLGDAEAKNNDKIIFYPIGYNSSDGKYNKTGVAVTTGFYNFCGTFDGNGHKISNFYQNTWEMKGDNNYYDATLQYYRDGMGLFGRVYGGTVKNLTVDHFSSDGEYTTTGVIAAYADGAIFENIAITNCNPRVYNIGNGGIVGCVGWYAKEAKLKTTFKNITVDNSNKISALWGSYDVACGGIVGQYYPTSGQSSANYPVNGGVDFVNCHVSAQMDVYNDVCGNYQYYAYRYAGMIIGSIRENLPADKNGHVYPDMTGITATGCTVNYGDWNDYYYCEFEKNGHPSYSGPDDYKFSRVPNEELVFNDDGTVTCTHNHSNVEDNRAVYLPFDQLFTGYGWGVTSKGLKDYEGFIDLGNQEESVVKFETKFTGNFLYRVGNGNEVSLGSLFKVADNIPDALKTISSSSVWVTIEKLDDNMQVSGTYSKSTTKNWTDAKIKFSGTGVVKVTIQDYIFCTPTELILEVVDAVNATAAMSTNNGKEGAEYKEYNVVLLNDCGFSSLEVSNGYTLYGNGFTLTCGSDSASLNFGQFVELNNGTLDNVQIVCPNYDYAALYETSQLKSNANRSETTNGTKRYFNAKSAVLATGNSQILNSRISGGRAALYASNGNVVVDNSRLEGGAVATVLISAANSVVFRDLVLVQRPTESTYKEPGVDKGKTLMGMSVLYLCDADGNAAPTTLEGSFVQYAWADSSCTAYMPDGTSSIAETALSKTAYTHSIDGKTCVNLGFAYMPNDGTEVAQPNNIVDRRSDNSSVPYDYTDVSARVPYGGIEVKIDTYVYSYKNTNGTDSAFSHTTDYVSNKYSDIITVNYADTTEGLTTGKSYGINGWVYELNVDLDKANGYKLDFSKLAMNINGVNVSDFKVNGEAKPASPVAVVAGATTYTLTATVSDKEYTATYVVTGVETSKRTPYLVDANGNEITVNDVAWGTGLCVTGTSGMSTVYSGAAPVLEGLYIRYWSVTNGEYKTVKLSDLTPSSTGKVNSTHNYWETSDGDYSLRLVNDDSYMHDSKKLYGMPVVYGGKLYFTVSDSSGLVSTGSGARTIVIDYTFKDNNGGVLEFKHTWSVAYNKNGAVKYNTLCGSSGGSSGGGTCIAEGSMITLADGSKKAVEELRKGDKVMAFDHLTGEVVYKDVLIVGKTYADLFYKNVFVFDDGTELMAINEHGIYDLDLRQYVNIGELNYQDYIGHRFVSIDSQGNVGVKRLVDVVTTVESGYKYDIVTDETLNYVVEDTLSVSHEIVTIMNSIAFGDDLCYDAEAMKADIEKYGLYTYEDFAEYCEREVFEQYNMAMMKIGVGKGLYTYEHLVYLLTEIALNDDVQIVG